MSRVEINYDEILASFNRAALAAELLDCWWCAVGPYDKPERMSEEDWDRIKNYFSFDDSE